ncbi:MAG: precorrin-6A synthase (deacetylating) [Deltaproteobacteria bacterium]|nr:precorrin-6A synthase (deacetylating) [Deltaproteobacteria bacterium]
MAGEPRATKKILVIGIGAGNPDYLTIQAVNALSQVDVFFIVDKGREKGDLNRIRREICQRFIVNPAYRWVEVPDPVRDAADPCYRTDVDSWRAKRGDLYRSLIADEMKKGECGAFLVWGDPALYDGTLPILERILAEGRVRFEYEVIPGISSMQALAARHRIALNRIGEAIQITTGRRLAGGFPDHVDNLVVFLDADMDLGSLPDDIDIYWGAYLGMEDEVLVSGKLKALLPDIERIRKAKKAEKGWIMDTYLLRRNTPDKNP